MMSANIVYYGSPSCRWVTRSVMAAELHGLILGFNSAIIVRTMVSKILGRVVHLDAYMDSKTVVDTMYRLGSTLETRLQIDAASLQESHLNDEPRSIYWIASSKNCADALTKDLCQADNALMTMTQTNRLQVSPTGWFILRTSSSTQSVMTHTRAKKKLRVSNS
jgi:hypothetical protein